MRIPVDDFNRDLNDHRYGYVTILDLVRQLVIFNKLNLQFVLHVKNKRWNIASDIPCKHLRRRIILVRVLGWKHIFKENYSIHRHIVSFIKHV